MRDHKSDAAFHLAETLQPGSTARPRAFIPALAPEEAKAILCGLFPDGIDVGRLSAEAKAEIRAAIDVVLGRSGQPCPEMSCPQYSQLLTSWSGARQRLSDERKTNEFLREALMKALAYCDAAVHPTEQYHDERESLFYALTSQQRGEP